MIYDPTYYSNKMKQQYVLIYLLFLCLLEGHLLFSFSSIESLASQLQSGVVEPQYDVKTLEGFNMDCLKMIKNSDQGLIAVFHSSIEQKSSGYNALYLGEKRIDWTKVVQLSQRGSQGYIYLMPTLNSYLVLYQLENHEHGNTLAIRYYESYQRLQVNNFMYEYQLLQRIDNQNVRNIGTPSIEEVTLLKQESNPHFNVYNLTIKFHYSPDGTRDRPGLGAVNLVPLRDFVDGKGQWIGGCKQRYSDWMGNTDSKVEQAIGRVRPYSKIGQRDLFLLSESGIANKYYLYQVNVNASFSWKDWRIYLYSEKDNRAVQLNLAFSADEDIANPHISLLQQDPARNSYTFALSFFLPSEGVVPGTQVRAGEMTALLTITP